MMAYFIKYATLHGSREDKQMSNFMLMNLAKGVCITNAILMAFYLSRFRTYRNSYLFYMHIPATILGIISGVKGTSVVFTSYMFDSCELSQRHALRDVIVHRTENE